MKRMYLTGVTLFTLASTPAISMAQDKVEADIGADLVSGYIWRGQDLGNISIQPSASVSYKGFSLSGWGSVGFDKDDTKEFDLTLGYNYKGFQIAVTDYWTDQGENAKTGMDLSGGKYFHYSSFSTAHVFEAQVGYDFGPVNINWWTNFGGNDGLNKSGKRAYSSYFAVGVPFKLGGLDWNVEAGAVPWATTFYNDGAEGFEVSNLTLGASKEIKITQSYSLPVFAQATWNPATEGAYFVFGISF